MTQIEHPSLRLLVGDAERERAENWLKDAYADGRLGESDLDVRLGMVMRSTNRRELNAAFYGIAPASAAPLPRTSDLGSPLGALAHLSGLFTWIVGPLLAYALAAPGSKLRREAAKAFNFQVLTAVTLVVVIAVGIAFGMPDVMGSVFLLGWLGWVISCVLGGVRAGQGNDWDNPVQRIVPLHVLPEGRPKRRRR